MIDLSETKNINFHTEHYKKNCQFRIADDQIK